MVIAHVDPFGRRGIRQSQKFAPHGDHGPPSDDICKRLFKNQRRRFKLLNEYEGLYGTPPFGHLARIVHDLIVFALSSFHALPYQVGIKRVMPLRNLFQIELLGGFPAVECRSPLCVAHNGRGCRSRGPTEWRHPAFPTGTRFHGQGSGSSSHRPAKPERACYMTSPRARTGADPQFSMAKRRACIV